MKSLERNIALLVIIKLSKWLMFYMPIVALFYTENGLSESMIFTLHAIYSFTIVVFEIPSGYLSDKFGRKNSLIIGSFLGFTGFACYSMSFGITGFVLAEIALGIGQSFVSGSDSAMLYDTLYDLKRKDDYLKLEGKITAIGNYAEAFAGFVGPLIAISTFRNTYYLQTAVAFTAIPAAFFLKEPHRHIEYVKTSFKHLLSIVHLALFKDKDLRANIFFSSIIGACTLTMAWYAQLIFKDIGIPGNHFGFYWAPLNLIVGVGSWIAYKIIARYGLKQTSLLIALIIPGVFIVSGIHLSYYTIAILLFFYFLRGIATPTLKNSINLITTSDVRATVLSTRSLLIRIIFSVIGPSITVLNNKISLNYALVITGIIFLTISILVYIPYRKSISNL